MDPKTWMTTFHKNIIENARSFPASINNCIDSAVQQEVTSI